MKRWFLILLIFPLFANAAYQRNQARPVNEVVFGQVETVRYISQQDIVHSKANGWETLLGAVVGGLIGNQFGMGMVEKSRRRLVRWRARALLVPMPTKPIM